MEKVKVLKIGKLPTGKKNCITDVADVRVGHVTLDFALDSHGMEVACTGVTAILPHGGTDAPLSDRQLLRVTKRCGIGLGRTGSHVSHGSGDIIIAFSTAQRIPHFSESHYETHKLLREDHPIFNQLFVGAAEATEEAILHSLLQAETTKGRNERMVHQYPNL